MKRGRLYACARREGYNVLAMGQHLDDLAERFVARGWGGGKWAEIYLYGLDLVFDWRIFRLRGGVRGRACIGEKTFFLSKNEWIHFKKRFCV